MPVIKEVSLSGFKGFSNTQIFNPAIPRGHPASGLSIVVGPNNGGKTALMEAIDLVARAQAANLDKLFRNDSTGYACELAIKWNDGYDIQLKSQNTNLQFLSVSVSHTGRAAHAIAFIPARRDLPSQIAPNASAREQYVGARRPIYTREANPEQLASRVSGWLLDQRFRNMLEDVLDFEFRLYPDGQRFFVKVEGNEHYPKGLGDGISSLLHLIDILHDAPDDSTIIIDEPETSLHPSYQRRVFDLLVAHSARVQIIYATHSPFMVDWLAILRGAKLVRIFRPKAGYCTIAELQPPTIMGLAGLSENYQNPHILGTNAKEVFFLSDRIILTEGQDDVVYYRKMASDLGIKIRGDFYGWGVGGAGNMSKIARVLKDLGFVKVIGLLDANKKSSLAELQKEFPAYQFQVIATDDVRDKKLDDGSEVKGLCDGSGKLHEQHREYVVNLLNEVNGFLVK